MIRLAAIPLTEAAPAADSVPEVEFPQSHINPITVGQTLYQEGRYSDAIATWQSTIAKFSQRGELPQLITVLNLLSAAHQSLAQWSDATVYIEQSLALLAEHSQAPELYGQALSTQASLQLNLGQPEQALELWQQAEDYYRQAENITGILGSQINQAETLQSLGYYRRSQQRLEVARQQLEALPDSIVKVVGLQSLGKAFQLTGDPRVSYEYMSKALASARRINATTELSSIYLSIGKLATEVESANISLAYFDAAEAAALTPQEKLQAQLEELSVYIETKQYESANSLAPRLFAQLRQQSASRTAVYNIVNFSHRLLQVPTPAITRSNLNQLLAQAVRFSNDLQDTRAKAHALRQMGQLYRETQQWTEAFELIEKSLHAARTTQSADVISQSAWQLGQLLKQKNKTKAAVEAYSEAIAAIQSLRGDLVAINQDLQFSYQKQVEPIYREFISLLLDIKTPETLKQARDVLEALQIAELDNFFREACIDLQVNQIDQIDPSATVAYSIILPNRLVTIYAKAGQPLQEFEVSIDSQSVQKTLQEYLNLLHLSSDKSQRLSTAQQIYNWLIRPAEDQGLLVSDQPAVFVLDGLLRNIPMASLYDGTQYLIEKYPVALSPGLQLIQSRDLNQQSIKALVGGVSEQRGSFSALPAVETEIETIHQLINSTKLLNSEFTRDAIAERLRSEPIDAVHLATHGQFSSDFNQTYFLTWDGVINIRELSELLRQREEASNKSIELLTLSACETATGDERATLGLAGLAVRSGARTTVATLWPIKDNVAAQLMTNFYQALQQPDTSKAEALRQAQIRLIRETNFDDPFFWSAYVLIGNWL
ncbi:MAG: CHAT domain-containing protein [Cyanobacteria bacterium P01_D01_bin.156]